MQCMQPPEEVSLDWGAKCHLLHLLGDGIEPLLAPACDCHDGPIFAEGKSSCLANASTSPYTRWAKLCQCYPNQVAPHFLCSGVISTCIEIVRKGAMRIRTPKSVVAPYL